MPGMKLWNRFLAVINDVASLGEQASDVQDLIDAKTEILETAGEEGDLDDILAVKTELEALAAKETELTSLAGAETELSSLASDDTGILAASAKVAAIVEVADASVASIAADKTSVNVTHGYGSQPKKSQIRLTPVSDSGDATLYWISACGATQFTISVNAAPGGVKTADFAWAVI